MAGFLNLGLEKDAFGTIGNFATGLFNLLTGYNRSNEFKQSTDPTVKGFQDVNTARENLAQPGTPGWNSSHLYDPGLLSQDYMDRMADQGFGRMTPRGFMVRDKLSEEEMGRAILSDDQAQEKAEADRQDRLSSQFDTAYNDVRGAYGSMLQIPGEFDQARQEGTADLTKQEKESEDALALARQNTAQIYADTANQLQAQYENYKSFAMDQIQSFYNRNQEITKDIDDRFMGQLRSMLDGEVQAARQAEIEIDQNAPPGARDALKEMRRDLASKRVSMVNSEQNAIHNQFRQQTMVELENSARTAATSLGTALGTLQNTQMGETGALGRDAASKEVEFAKIATDINKWFSGARADWNSAMLTAKANATTAAFTNYLNGETALFQMSNMLPDDYTTLADGYGEFLNFQNGLDQDEINRATQEFNMIAGQFQIQWMPEMAGESAFNSLVGGSNNSLIQAGNQEDLISQQAPSDLERAAPFFQGGTSFLGDWAVADALGGGGSAATVGAIPPVI